MRPLWSPSSIYAPRRLGLNKRISRMTVIGLCCTVLTILIFWHQIHGSYHVPDYYPFPTLSDFYPVSVDIEGKTTKDLCATFPKHVLESIQPVLKMGHGENRTKIKAQFDSVSACFEQDDLLIFSDHEETIYGHEVIDILADLPAGYYEDNPDFVDYVWQKEMRANGTLDKDKEATARINGWRIDKYKFLPMVERAWRTKPNKDFYFFFETDTYVFWDNVFRFLHTFDPEKPLYMGSPSPGRHDAIRDIKTWFANGGPGFVLSRGAIKTLLARKATSYGQFVEEPITEKWLPLLREDCCGDSVLGWALWNVGISLQGYWPMFNPHPLQGIPFSEKYWCQPVLTLHKTLPQDMVDVWRWEFSRRIADHPLLYSDLWEFHHPGDRKIAFDWDNDKWDGWVAPAEARLKSFEDCEKYCQGYSKCLGFTWRGGDEAECLVSTAIRYGDSRPEEIVPWPEEKDAKGKVKSPPPDRKNRTVDFTSGWMVDRIDSWRIQHNCSMVQWVGPSIKRIF
ncbi:hypothetical protein BGZ63DRAFT_362431 [Mariannaea sp. PMI_226]|nr:hypothetical protein BGZ63DRAFT_362431 [Mariannaea sp. PMI_226]